MSDFSFTLNRHSATVDGGSSTRIALHWLREERGLAGTKEGCAEGDCGACSILVSPAAGGPPRPANACLLVLGQLAGRSVLTIEGLGDGARPHPLQSTIADSGGTQCGFCTPGFVIAGAALLDRNASPDEDAIHDALAGNLCRCTGYRPIVEAVQLAAKLHPPLPVADASDAAGELGGVLVPTTLKQAARMAADHPGARYLAGGTDLILERNGSAPPATPLILLSSIPEITEVRQTRSRLIVGGACPIEDTLGKVGRRWPHFERILRRFGSVQIRSQATLGGNLATCSPIGDAAPCLIALDAKLRLAGREGERQLAVEDFAVGYRKSALRPGEVVAQIEIPLEGDLWAWKVSKRFDQDISTLSAAFRVHLSGNGSIRQVRAAFGGLADRPLRCRPVEEALEGGDFAAAARAAGEFFQPIDDLRGSADYRAAAAAGLVRRLELSLAGGEEVEVGAL